MMHQARELRAMYRRFAQMTNDDNCNVCASPWGTVHSESCRFYREHGELEGHAAEVVARFLRCIRATEPAELVARMIGGMKLCKADMTREGVLEVLEAIHTLTDTSRYKRGTNDR